MFTNKQMYKSGVHSKQATVLQSSWGIDNNILRRVGIYIINDDVGGVATESWQSLRRVFIIKCSKLISLPINGLQPWTSLESSVISDCQGLISIDDGCDELLQIHFPDGGSSSLIELTIAICPNLHYFPVEQWFRCLTRLKTLKIPSIAEAIFMTKVQRRVFLSLKPKHMIIFSN